MSTASTVSDFRLACQLDDVPNPGKATVVVDDRIIVVFRVQEEVYCLEDRCTHDDGPLGDGRLEGYEIACPRHGARFDIRSGRVLSMPATEPTIRHDVRVEDGQVWVRLYDEARRENPLAPATSVGGASASPQPLESTPQPPQLAGSPVGSTAVAGLLTEDHVREQLKKVIDPELFVNIIDLGLIYVVDVQDLGGGSSKVAIDMTMTSPACPAGPQLIANSKSAVAQLPGVAEVEVKIVMDPPWTPDRMTDDARDQLGIF